MIFKKLLISKSYKGPLKGKIIPQNKFYLYGIRNNKGIINLEYTVQNLKRSLKLIQAIISKIKHNPKLKILIFINDFPVMNSIFKDNKQISIINKKWVPGTLTKDYSNRKKIPLIIIFSKTNNISISKECQKLKIPTIVFSNLDFNFSDINYTVPVDTKNVQSIYFLISLFKKFYE